MDRKDRLGGRRGAGWVDRRDGWDKRPADRWVIEGREGRQKGGAYLPLSDHMYGEPMGSVRESQMQNSEVV